MAEPMIFSQSHCNRDYQEFSPKINRVGTPGEKDTFYSLSINSCLSVLLSLPRLIELNSVLSTAVEQYRNDSTEPTEMDYAAVGGK